MNKLLQHIIDAGDVDHRVLPGLQKMQTGGKAIPKRGENVIIDGQKMNTYSDEYENAYNKGIGQWVNYDQGSKQWKPLPANLPNSAYANAEFVSNPVTLPEVTVTSKMNPYMSAARKKAKEQAGALEAFRKQEEAGYPKWYKNSTLYNPEKDKETQEDHYNTWVNRSAYQNLVDNIPQKEDESRIDYINRFNNLAGKNAVSSAREANVTEPFDPSELAKLGQWGWKGLNHIGAGTQALFTSNPTDFMSTMRRGIDRGNQPTYGMLPDEAKEVGVFQPFETMDDLAYKYAFRPALKGYDNLTDPKNKQARNFGSRYLGASDEDKLFTSLLNPLNYISGAEILSGGRNLVRGAEGLKGAYNTVAKGESFLPIAWKSPAVGLTQEASADMFRGVANADKLTDAERALLLEYQYDSKPFTGRTYGDGVPNIDQAKRQALNNVIKNNEVNFNNNAILTRKFNPDNRSLGAEFSNGRLNLGDRPTSFSAGVGNSSYGSGAVDRIVIPNRYSKNMGNKFLANEYGIPSDKTFDLLSGETKNFAASRGVMADDIINVERELIGTGLDLKRIGKVKNDIGGYDHIVRPRRNNMPSGQAFGPNNNNSGFFNFLNARGVAFNPENIVKDYYTGLKAGLPEAIPNALGKFLRNTGLYPKARNVGKPFSEVFPTGANRVARMAEQDRGFQHGQDFMNEYLYPNGSRELRPELVDKIREIIPDSKLATSTDNFSKNGELINGTQYSNLENPYVGTEQRLVKNTTWGEGREGVPAYDLDVLNRKRGSIGGINVTNTGNAYTVRNYGPFYNEPYSVARTGVHENAHSFQKFGFRPTGRYKKMSTWGDELAKYDDKLEYWTPNYDTDAGKLFGEHMVTPTKKNVWYSSPNELHSELMSEKYNDFMQSIQKSDLPDAMTNKEFHKTLIDELANPTEETLQRILNRGNLNSFFKPETTLENKLKLLKILPAAIPAVGAAAAMGAKEQKYGGESNMFKVFAQDGVEYKGPSIVDYLATKGYSGNKAFRKGLAEKYGVEDYNYSAAKNTELLNKLRENDDLLEKEYEQTQTPVSAERIMQIQQRQPAPVRNTQPLYRPSFMDEETPKIKVDFSLQPKVVYDKFSLKPKMVIPMPVTPTRAAVNTPPPVVQPVAATTAPTPQINIPKFDPYSYMRSGVQNPPVVAPPVNTPVPFNSNTTFGNYNPADPFAFLRQNPNKLGPYTKENVPVVIPANKPVVETKKQSVADSKETTWYEDLWNGFEDAVNKSPLDFSKMTMAPSGLSPEGAIAITKDVTAGAKKGLVNLAKFVSPDNGKIVENYFKRQDLKNNDNLQETKTKFNIPSVGRPAISTGDTIDIDKNRYVIPAMIDLNQTNWDTRNRGEYKDIDTEAADITTFQSFEKAKDYFAKNVKDANNSTYIGVDAAGKIKVGNKADFVNTDYRITKTFGNKIVDFIDEADGSMKLKDSKAKASNKHLSPVVKVMGDDGKMTEGSLNLLIPKGNRDTKSFGQITGGRVIFKTPKGEQFLVSGSAEDIRRAFKQIKGDNPYVEAITLDNGTYAMGLRNKNQKITAQQLKDYQGENTSGSAFLYLKPGNYTRGTNEAAPQTQFRDVPMNTPNIRTKNDESFKKGHPLTNEQKAIILHHTGYSDTSGVSKGMSKAMQGVAKQFSNPGESSHVVIDFDGTRYNYARPDQVTFHAGKSMMNGRDNVNDFGVGIEFQGDTDKTRLTDKQINSFVEYAGPIIKKNKIPLSSIITHKQIRTNYMKANPKDKEVLGKPDVNEIDYERIIKALKKKGYYAQGGPVVDPMGQWAHPGKVTRIPGSDITMQGVNYPVLGVGSNGKKQMMYPGKDYSFGGAEHVDEYPMMQTGGYTLPEVTVYGHRNPTAKAYFDRWRKEAEDWQDRESPVDSIMASYLAGEQMYSKYKGHDIQMIDKQDRPMLRVTPFSDTLQIHNPESDYRGDSLISELAHKVQLNKKGNLGFLKSHIGNDYLNTLKNMSLGDIFNADSWKSAYDKNYYAPGTQEYEAHSIIEPKLREEFQILADKEYDKLTASKNKMKGGGYVVTRSHDRKGKTHKVTGPGGVVKYFGDSNLGQHPKDEKRKAAFYARHKTNLANNPFFRAFARKTWEDGGTIPQYQMAGQVSKTDSVRHQANKILKYEQLRGGPGGAPLPQYSNPKYMDMLMGNVYPEVRKIMPNASAMEAGEAMDFIFNAGWDKANNKITKDPRAFALQEYYRENNGSKLDADGKWAGRKNAPYSFDQEYDGTIGKLPENQRRVLMNKGRDWYYRNINNPAPGVPNSDYNDTWYGRIWNTNDYQPFNPNNPNFTPKKQMGGVALGKQYLEKKHSIKVTYKK